MTVSHKGRVSLVRLASDQKGTVVEIAGGAALKNRMMSMGIYLGRSVAKLGHFSFAGPVMVKVGRTTIALGHTMAQKIIVETK